MTTENLNFVKPHMVFVDGYFYMFDEDLDVLAEKTDDGVMAFTYPFDTLLTDTMKSIEHDGINFWTMHNSSEVGEENGSLTINRWRIENYVCNLKSSIILTHPDHDFSAEAFSVEHYHCTISGSYSSGDTILYVDADELPGDLYSGMSITIGPNSAGSIETHNVQHVSNNEITISDPLENNYSEGDSLIFYNYIWLFNNAYGEDDSTGCLYKINAYSGSILHQYPSGVYKDVKACTFAEIDHFIEYGVTNSLMYVKASNLLFINIYNSELNYYGSMAMDNIDDEEIDTLEVYDITVWGNNVYRLQERATYFGETDNWDNYNYQPATFNIMVTSIALTAEPNVIAANEVSTSDLVARVKDQFFQPIPGRVVYFEVASTGGTGVVSPSIVSGYENVNTDSEGKAYSIIRSGNAAELVSVNVTIEQS